MYQGEEPPHRHHLPDDGGDDEDEYDDHPQNPYPATHQQPPSIMPQQPLQPPKPLFSPSTSRPPSRKRGSTPPPPPTITLPPQQQPLQPPKPIFHEPSSPPSKPVAGGSPPYGHHGHGGRNCPQIFAALIVVLLLLLGVTALVLWLLYRPSEPHFATSSVAVYSLNTTTTGTAATPSFVASSLHLIILTRNPSRRTSLYYDRLTAAVHYNSHPITPPAALPPLHHRKRSTVMVLSVVGGGAPVAVPPELVEGLAADETYGVVGLSWVLVGRVRYKFGWFKSGHSKVYVRCNIIVGFKNAAGVRNPYGQMPLLGNPPCFVDI